MPRKPRLFLPRATYHVYCRVARGEFVFDDVNEAAEFVDTARRVRDLGGSPDRGRDDEDDRVLLPRGGERLHRGGRHLLHDEGEPEARAGIPQMVPPRLRGQHDRHARIRDRSLRFL